MSDSKEWKDKTGTELVKIAEILNNLGFLLDDDQPHIRGERFLMTKEKLVLVGKRKKDGLKVIIKTSNNNNGKKEIIKEKRVRDTILKINFTNDTLLVINEIFFGVVSNYLIWITNFIPQEKVFSSYPLDERFFMILKALENQESFHATTFEHEKIIQGVFDVIHGRDYISDFERFKNNIEQTIKDETLIETMSKALSQLRNNKHLLDMYSGYLTHTDLAPANFRISGRDVYMIDLSSMMFGNKYDGWARFQNYALVHSPGLETVISEYVRQNRGESEYHDLRLMRIYKTGLLLDYYSKSIQKTAGNLLVLTHKRIDFWHTVLRALLDDVPVSNEIVVQYREERNSLRSKEEMDRQKEFNLPTI